MTEVEWLECTEPGKMIDFLANQISRRKLRWFAIACCRLLWEHLKDEGVREALDRAEQYADRRLADSTAYRWYLRANRGKRTADPSRPWELHACHAVSVAALPDTRARAFDSYVYVKFALIERAIGRRVDLWEPEYQAAEQAALRELVPLLRDIAGDPFRSSPPLAPAILAWNDAAVVRLAEAAYNERHLPEGTLDSGRLAVLADALEEAGCTDADILDHLRGPGPHVRGCWSVDMLLGKS